MSYKPNNLAVEYLRDLCFTCRDIDPVDSKYRITNVEKIWGIRVFFMYILRSELSPVLEQKHRQSKIQNTVKEAPLIKKKSNWEPKSEVQYFSKPFRIFSALEF